MKRLNCKTMFAAVFFVTITWAVQGWATEIPPGKRVELFPPVQGLPQFLKSPRTKIRGSSLIFDFPVTYNKHVEHWINYFRTHGKSSYRKWLQRSGRYFPLIQPLLQQANMPLDLAYVAMIESGFSPYATSSAQAVGIWQFIRPTAERFGLKIDWWIDERRDFYKSTMAAIRYKKELYQIFESWHLVAASYNSGENRIKRLMKKYRTNNYWQLVKMGALPEETSNYVPKVIAANMIAKAPGLYGFRDIQYQQPFDYEYIYIPGGHTLKSIASKAGIPFKQLKRLNPELLVGYIPSTIKRHRIRVPRGYRKNWTQLLAANP